MVCGITLTCILCTKSTAKLWENSVHFFTYFTPFWFHFVTLEYWYNCFWVWQACHSRQCVHSINKLFHFRHSLTNSFYDIYLFCYSFTNSLYVTHTVKVHSLSQSFYSRVWFVRSSLKTESTVHHFNIFRLCFIAVVMAMVR